MWALPRLAVLALVLAATSAIAGGVHTAKRYDIQSISLARRMIVTGDPVPPGIVELKFGEFFRTPAGRYGLEPTDRLTGLAGQRVRIVGYIVGQDTPSPGRFILAPFRLTLATAADGPADDLPPATAWVELPPGFERADLPPVPVPVAVTGVLDTGPAQEQHGRVSYVRIAMDADDLLHSEGVKETTPAGPAVVATATTSKTDTKRE